MSPNLTIPGTKPSVIRERGSTPAGMTDGQISKTDLSRFKMGGQLSPEYLFYKIVSQTSLNNHSFTMFN